MWDLLDQVVSVGVEPLYTPKSSLKSTIAKRVIFANIPTLHVFYDTFLKRHPRVLAYTASAHRPAFKLPNMPEPPKPKPQPGA